MRAQPDAIEDECGQANKMHNFNAAANNCAADDMGKWKLADAPNQKSRRRQDDGAKLEQGFVKAVGMGERELDAKHRDEMRRAIVDPATMPASRETPLS
ncbi:hypothetical protein QO002_004299 [Pararhizobium capsulatum DSM 1112]|uniref:Uncharacterized protein n=1 Tax=Pararhizobium capsulatum DSM 1112 TaxID=1121113 RepID=A0ABU0BV28_9HYPH|nr:hypothetical protein [Pararhizobium capsulatum]MDQ0322093.1 hypothetical protein [Pararhizobium capsulatum DSM 1112]